MVAKNLLPYRDQGKVQPRVDKESYYLRYMWVVCRYNCSIQLGDVFKAKPLLEHLCWPRMSNRTLRLALIVSPLPSWRYIIGGLYQCSLRRALNLVPTQVRASLRYSLGKTVPIVHCHCSYERMTQVETGTPADLTPSNSSTVALPYKREKKSRSCAALGSS